MPKSKHKMKVRRVVTPKPKARGRGLVAPTGAGMVKRVKVRPISKKEF